MSRPSSDRYRIPLQPLGRGRRLPQQTYSYSSNSPNDLGRGSSTEIADDEDEPVSTDDAPLIRKREV